jgi:hypothetical protein
MSEATKGKDIDGRRIVRILYWLVVLCGLWFAYLNIKPYATVIQSLLVAATPDQGLIDFIMRIPIINGVAATIQEAIHWILGFILWAAIQTVEILPIVLRRDRAYLRRLIQESSSKEKYQVKDTDDPALAALKKWYNRFPYLSIARSRNVALFIYAIDFLICLAVYPPVEGDFGQFVFVLTTGQWQLIDWGNLALMFITLFVIELIVLFLFWLGEVAYFMRSAHAR